MRLLNVLFASLLSLGLVLSFDESANAQQFCQRSVTQYPVAPYEGFDAVYNVSLRIDVDSPITTESLFTTEACWVNPGPDGVSWQKIFEESVLHFDLMVPRLDGSYRPYNLSIQHRPGDVFFIFHNLRSEDVDLTPGFEGRPRHYLPGPGLGTIEFDLTSGTTIEYSPELQTPLTYGSVVWNDQPASIILIIYDKVEFVHGPSEVTYIKSDFCPSDPGKSEPGQCGCGVEDVDANNDGIVDCEEPCAAGSANTGMCRCDNSNDDDGDGRPNCVDECPNDPYKTIPNVCGCGVVEFDADQNGVADCLENPNFANPGEPQRLAAPQVRTSGHNAVVSARGIRKADTYVYTAVSSSARRHRRSKHSRVRFNGLDSGEWRISFSVAYTKRRGGAQRPTESEEVSVIIE